MSARVTRKTLLQAGEPELLKRSLVHSQGFPISVGHPWAPTPDEGGWMNKRRHGLLTASLVALLLGCGVLSAVALGASGGSSKATTTKAAKTKLKASTSTTTTTTSTTPRSNEDAAHEANETAAQEAAEDSGQRPAHGDRGGPFKPNEDAAHEAQETAAQEAAEDAGQRPARP